MQRALIPTKSSAFMHSVIYFHGGICVRKRVWKDVKDEKIISEQTLYDWIV